MMHNMPILSRLPNIISSTLSSTPQKKPAHIDETRTLELTISRLREQLSDSRSEWQTEREEWAGESETVMACHRIAHLQTNVLLAKERVAHEHERDLARKKRVAAIRRDHDLILSKARERELEIELKENSALLHDAEKAREAAEQQTNHVQAELVSLQARLSAANTNVDGLTSRLEDAQTALAENERLNIELQQENAALKIQVGEPDERGGGALVEELHQQCATLESQIKHLESRVTEEQKKASANEKALQKERKNAEKLQLALEEQSDQATKAEEEASLLEQQSQHHKDELEKALWQIKQLKAGTQLDGRSRVHSDHRSNEAETVDPSGSKAEEESGVKSKKTTKKPFRVKDVARKPSISTDRKGKRKAPPDEDSAMVESGASDERATKSTTTKQNSEKNKTKTKKPPSAAAAAADVDDETSDVGMPRKKKMRKLNITNPFASAQPNSLDWANQFNLGDGGLDIPTELSPVKVPARSLAGKSASTSYWKS